MYSNPGTAKALIKTLVAKSGRIICKHIIPPTVINPPSPFHLKASSKPIMVLPGNRIKAIASLLLMAVILESVNNSPIVIINKNMMTKAPSILADQRIILSVLFLDNTFLRD